MKSQPIWHADPDSVVYLKANLQFDSAHRSGWLRCACSGPFQLFLDGEPIGSGPGGELTQVPAWDRIDIEAAATAATSVLIVRAAAGSVAGWFVCEGQISGTAVGTDPTWSSLAGSAPDSASIFHETHSAALQNAVLDLALHGAAAIPWSPCTTVAAPPPADLSLVTVTMIDLEARELVASGEIDALQIPDSVGALVPLTTSKCVHPEGLVQGHGQRTTIRTSQSQTGVCVVLDFGRQVHGVPLLSLETSSEGAVIDLFFGGTADQFDSAAQYTCCVGRQRWSGLHAHSFRFVLARFSGFTEHGCIVEQLAVGVRRVEHVAKEAGLPGGTISPSKQLEALWAVGAQSNNACRQQVYRLDAYPAPYDWFSALPFFLNDCSHRADTTEGLAMLVSTSPSQGRSPELRRWLGYPLFVDAYLQYSGDRDTVEASLETVTWLLQQIQQQQQPSGLLPAADGEWSATRLTILAAGAVKTAVRLFDSFSLTAERVAAQRCLDALLLATQSRWSQQALLYEEDGKREVPTQLTNALALYFGLADETRQQHILAGLRAGSGIEAIHGLTEAFYLVAGLWEAKANRRAMHCLETYWGRLLERDGSTWLDKQSRSVDVSDGAPGPDYFLASRVIGVRPATPGYESIEIEPPSIGIDHLCAELPAGGGSRLRVEWWRPESQPTCRIEVQTGSDVPTRLCMPKLGLRFPEISVNDLTVWRNDKVVPNPWVHEIADEPERVVVTVSGSRSFTAQLS